MTPKRHTDNDVVSGPDKFRSDPVPDHLQYGHMSEFGAKREASCSVCLVLLAVQIVATIVIAVLIRSFL